ncbi:hypothetical protein GU927_014095 [Rhodobacteraceae bacterium HSP-20]|jgi:hypothetical protein|uniref:Tetratrico peptide repeat group 5 domain-containing protein n=1 Tax=Paragemmobacter amnigenus TaxID=2852097 RepID=A0ABS6J650_9RHOB|nr:hypothetical protein [Rhodobacter amnigenus]MBU9698977.1 hypothetical protein [Rhodobacter amnigenus]MBV4390204.1 hypothetical protein [Rhodobacter amnigenus]
MGQLRKQAKALSLQARRGDVSAARQLLSHSVRMGHRNLAVRRLFLALAMGARNVEHEARYCAEIISVLPDETIRKMMAEARCNADIYTARGNHDD